jgi:peptidoglycan/xylan/chitin deacetylase (PgdA/CDA1 family)
VFAGRSFAAHAITAWPGNKKGAVSLTFDDGCPSHISIGVTSLNARGFKGTFFLYINNIGNGSPGWDAWRNAANNGHEIGSHTISHPYLTTLSLSQVQYEMEGAKAAIDAQITTQKCLTFAYPFGAHNDDVASIANNIYIASRNTNCPLNSEPINWGSVNSCSPGDLGSLISAADAAEQQGKWLDHHFHSLDNGNDCYRDDFFTTAMWMAYLDYLTTKNNLYVGTFGSVAKYIRERTSATLLLVSNSSDQIVLSLSDTLADAIYDQPLTIRSEVPSHWIIATVQQGSSTVEVNSTVEGTTTVIYYHAIPDRGYITLRNPQAANPQITTLVPSNATAGSSGFVLQVTGNNFVPGSVVRWNGANRVTTFVSVTKLNASVMTADLTTPGTMPVTVLNPDGSLSNAMAFEVRAPQPAVIGLSPSWQISGGSSFTLTVDGSNFVSGAKVRWNGSDRATSFVSSTELQATIPAADITTVGTASVTVYNPPPGGGTSNAISFNILPALVSLSVSPSSVVGGTGSTGTVTLNGPAPSGGAVVSLSSSNPSVASVPSSVTVGNGNTSAAFPVTTVAVSSTTAVNISALYGGVNRSSPLTVNPPPLALVSLSVSPSSVVGGTGSTGTVTLNGPASSGGAVVSLSSGNPSVASVPGNVTIESGNTSAAFPVSTVAVSSTTAVNISALYGGVNRSSPLTVETPAHPISLTGNYAGGGCSMVSSETGSRPGGGFTANLLLLVSPFILLRMRRWRRLRGWAAAMLEPLQFWSAIRLQMRKRPFHP